MGVNKKQILITKTIKQNFATVIYLKPPLYRPNYL